MLDVPFCPPADLAVGGTRAERPRAAMGVCPDVRRLRREGESD